MLGTDNLGFCERRDAFSNLVAKPGKAAKVREYNVNSVHFYGSLNLDFIYRTQPILNATKLKITFTLADPDFVLMHNVTSKNVKFQIESCFLQCPLATVTDDLYGDIIHTLKKEHAMYHFMRRQVTNINIAAGVLTYTTDTLFVGGELPAKMLLSFVKTAAYQGDRTLNPYNFLRVDHKVSIVKVTVTLNGSHIDGLDLPISDSIKVDFYRLYMMTGLTRTPFSNSITLNKFKEGCVHYSNIFVCQTTIDY